MQENERILAKTVGKILKDLRKKNPQKYVLFCDFNNISSSTLDAIEKGTYNSKFSTIFHIVRALGISFAEFAEILENELPKEGFELK